MLRLAAIQRHLKKDDMCVETCQEGIVIAKALVEKPDIKESKERLESIVKLQAEFLEMLFHQYAFTKDFKSQSLIA